MKDRYQRSKQDIFLGLGESVWGTGVVAGTFAVNVLGAAVGAIFLADAFSKVGQPAEIMGGAAGAAVGGVIGLFLLTPLYDYGFDHISSGNLRRKGY